jgi:diguanylate cyclase (GGDEF)-like protein/PAS domain S-box-containing protein
MTLPTEVNYSRKVFEAVSCGISISDARAPDMPLIYVNPAFERMTGYTADEVYGRNCRFLQSGDTDQPDIDRMREALRKREDARVILKNYRRNGTLFWNELYLSPIFDEAGQLTHYVGIQNDVTERVESREQMAYLAHHDALTGLANRKLMMEQLKMALLRARRNGGGVAVLFFDVDHFKDVNDHFGHDAGDMLLQIVAERLRAGARADETVARMGGDEFVVVLEYGAGDREPGEVMKRLRARVCEPVHQFKGPFAPSVSVGMAVFPADGDTPEYLLKAADLNMYMAKKETRQKAGTGDGIDAPR